MKMLDQIRGIDIYLLDQFLKERVHLRSSILDAGCGSGRNIKWLLKNRYRVAAFDPDPSRITPLLNEYASLRFNQGSIEDKPFSNETFDFIICNAVLHFATDHTHFHRMFENLVEMLNDSGILFIQMTSNIGLELLSIKANGRCLLPDLSERYVITRKQVDDLKNYHQLELVEPVKSVKVENLRTMSTLVFQKT